MRWLWHGIRGRQRRRDQAVQVFEETVRDGAYIAEGLRKLFSRTASEKRLHVRSEQKQVAPETINQVRRGQREVVQMQPSFVQTGCKPEMLELPTAQKLSFSLCTCVITSDLVKDGFRPIFHRSAELGECSHLKTETQEERKLRARIFAGCRILVVANLRHCAGICEIGCCERNSGRQGRLKVFEQLVYSERRLWAGHMPSLVVLVANVERPVVAT
jgi:hypothetical protein